MHKEQSLVDYNRFVRERAELYGPNVMSSGDMEGINRYLGVGSLRSYQGGGATNKKAVKFRHACDFCGESYPRIDCVSAPQPGAPAGNSQIGSGLVSHTSQVGGGTRR